MIKGISEQKLIKKIDNLEEKRGLSFSSHHVMVILWMLVISLASAGFIWYGIAIWYDPIQSILNIGMGIWLVILAVSRIVLYEIEGSK